MGKFTMTHEINCNADTFWRLFRDKEFNETLYREGLGFPEYTITEQRETDTELIRVVRATPKMDVPAPVAKLFGSELGYTEQGSLNKATNVYRFKTIPKTMADKLRTEGTMRVEPIGDGKVRRIAEMDIEAKVFGVGGLIESSAEKQLREGWDRSAAFTNRWIAQGKAV